MGTVRAFGSKRSPCRGSEPPIADVQEEPEEGEAIVVGTLVSNGMHK